MKLKLLRLVLLLFFLSLSWLNAQVTNITTSNTYTTIQAGIEAASPGDVLSVNAGTFTEDITIGKQVTLLGPKAGIPGTDLSRGSGNGLDGATSGEAVITGAPDYSSDGTVTVTADNVIIDGFFFDVDEGPQGNNTGYVLKLLGSNCSIENSVFESYSTSAQPIEIAVKGEANLVRNNYIMRTNTSAEYSGGIEIGGPYRAEGPLVVTIENNSLSNVYLDATTSSDGSGSNWVITGNSVTPPSHNLAFSISSPGYNSDPLPTGFNLTFSNNGSLAGISEFESASNGGVSYFTKIQTALDKVADGGSVNILAGTFNEVLDLAGKSLTINGAGSTQTIVDAAGTSGYAIKNFGDGVTIQDLQLINSQNYGFKISGTSNITLTNILVNNSAKTGIDLNGVIGASLTNIEVNNTVSGFGLMIGDSKNVTVNNVTTSGNPWGGVTVQSYQRYYAVDVDNIDFQGSFNASDDIPFLIEQDPYPDASTYYDITDVTIPDKFNYIVYGLRSGPNYKQWYYFETLDEAKSFASGLVNSATYTYLGVYISDIDGSNYYVIDDLAIQDAIDNASYGDVITVPSGTYNALTVNTDGIILVGEDGSIINNGSPAITVNASNVTITGFTFLFPTQDWSILVNSGSSNISINNCNFFVDYAINNASGNPDVNAQYNYWGDPSGPSHASNPSGTGSVISDRVDYSNVLQWWGSSLSPGHGVTGISIEPTFTWDNVPSIGTYKLYVDDQADFSTPLFEGQVNGTSKVMNELETNFPLSNNSKYYWKVAAVVNGNEYVSGTWEFKTIQSVNVSAGHPTGGTVYTTSTMFTWWLGQATGGMKFKPQIVAKSSSPTPLEWSNAALMTTTSNFYHTFTLNGGTKYYWRVVVLNNNDQVISYSSVYTFTTAGGSVTAYPSWPIGGNIIYNLKPTYYWYTMQYESGASYKVYVVEDGNNGNDLTKLDDDVYVSELVAGTNTNIEQDIQLKPSTKYYWQVKTTYGTDVTYSSIAAFKTYDAPGVVPTKPTLSYPTGGTTIYTTTPTLYWYIEGYNTGTLTFEVLLSVDGGTTWFNPPAPYTTTNTYLQISGLAAGQSYKWKITSTDGSTTVESESASFSIAGGIGTTPVLYWPTGNATLHTSTPILSWGLSGSSLGWSYYVVKWNEGSTAPVDWTGTTTGSYTTTDLNETSYTISTGLTYGKKYFWAVALSDGATPLTHADFVSDSFTIVGSNVSIVQLNPSNNSTVNTKSPTFTWYINGAVAGITHYRVTYSNSEYFAANVETVITTSPNADVNLPLSAGATYWWYVELSYDGGSTWVNPSSTWNFTVAPGASSVVPIAASPANGVQINSSSAQLSWFLPVQSSSALSYDIELANNKDFHNSNVISDLNQLNATVEDLEKGEYFWRVRSKTGGEVSGYSTSKNFKVDNSITGVENDNLIPNEFSLDQNYPNPFNPETTINFALASESYVNVKIYNMLGQEIKTLVSKEMKAGRYSIKWSGENNYGNKVVSGTYVYRITAANYTQARKMILLK